MIGLKIKSGIIDSFGERKPRAKIIRQTIGILGKVELPGAFPHAGEI